MQPKTNTKVKIKKRSKVKIKEEIKALFLGTENEMNIRNLCDLSAKSRSTIRLWMTNPDHEFPRMVYNVIKGIVKMSDDDMLVK